MTRLPKTLSLVIVCTGLALLTAAWAPLAGPEKPRAGEIKLWPQYVKMDSWAIKLPVPRSEEIADIGFTGRYATYEHADTWYPSWASDGILYSPWTDGRVGTEECSSAGKDAHTGQAKIEGDDPLNLKITNLGTVAGDPKPYEGRYPCGSLVHNGVWYYGTYCLLDHPAWSMNWPILAPFVGFRVSRDFGKTWQDTPRTSAEPLFGEKTSVWGAEPVKIGSPHFVDFGKNMEHSPDGKAYLVSHGASAPDPNPRAGNLSWITGDEIYLARVRPSPETMNDPQSYEFFAGLDKSGRPVWSGDFSKLQPIFSWNNHCGCVTMTYNAPLRRYIMCITDGWPTIKSMDTYILESSEITGPWKVAAYWKDFGPQSYFVNIPSKFISPDGRTAWLSYSANFTYGQNDPAFAGNPPGSGYQWCLHEIRFLDRPEYDRLVNPISVGIEAGERQEFPRLQGPYLGQKPPEMTPQLFAPGIISTDEEEGSSGFARNGTVFLFQKFLSSRSQTVSTRLCHTFITRLENGAWTVPERIPFWETMSQNGDFVFSSDDKTMLYQVRTETESGSISHIWRVEVKNKGWGERAPFPPPVNTSYFESFASDTTAGALYFFSRRPGGKGQSDLYMCEFKDGRYSDAINLDALNTEYQEWDPFIAPDGSYLIFCSTKPGGFGRDDIYITFKGKDGSWTPPVNMGEEVNSPGSENSPYITRDGRYFFFTSTRNGSRDTFWVRAEYLDRFRR